MNENEKAAQDKRNSFLSFYLFYLDAKASYSKKGLGLEVGPFLLSSAANLSLFFISNFGVSFSKDNLFNFKLRDSMSITNQLRFFLERSSNKIIVYFNSYLIGKP